MCPKLSQVFHMECIFLLMTTTQEGMYCFMYEETKS